jgi:hypothetical protein
MRKVARTKRQETHTEYCCGSLLEGLGDGRISWSVERLGMGMGIECMEEA